MKVNDSLHSLATLLSIGSLPVYNTQVLRPMALRRKKSFWAKGGRFTRKNKRKGSSGEESNWASELSPQIPWPHISLYWDMKRQAIFLIHIPPSPEFQLSESRVGLPVTRCREKGSLKEMDPGWRSNARACPAWNHGTPWRLEQFLWHSSAHSSEVQPGEIKESTKTPGF